MDATVGGKSGNVGRNVGDNINYIMWRCEWKYVVMWDGGKLEGS